MSEEAPTDEEIRKKDIVRGIVTNTISLVFLGGVGYALNIPKLAAVSLAVNWFVFFVHGAPCDSEKFFDATGSLTYITLVCVAAYTELQKVDNKVENLNLRSRVTSVMGLVWAARLGSYLLIRVCKAGKDSRFGELRRTPIRWMGVWAIQAVWCFLVISPVLVMMMKQECKTTIVDYIGWCIWGVGFLIECIADWQKSYFRNNPANKDKFITTGLWARSRHPNYFGEITIWLGMTIAASSCLSGSEYFVWMSPFTTIVLLLKVSGIPLLEKQGQDRWGEDPAYIWYLKHVPVLIPALSSPPAYDPDSTGVALA